MRIVSYPNSRLLEFFSTKKIATIEDLKQSLGTAVSMTVFRKLRTLDYLSSCSHRGKYYTLHKIAQFDENGLWFYDAILFSIYGSFQETVKHFVESSEHGMSNSELDRLLKFKSGESLLNLYRSNRLYREKFEGVYVYFSVDDFTKRKQLLTRKTLNCDFNLGRMQPEVLMNEIKAAIIIFYSTLDERQRRLYAGIESLKFGHGGDILISDILGINVKTVAKGRNELLCNTVNIDTVRSSGGGRKKKK